LLENVPIEVVRGDRLMEMGQPMAALEQYRVVIAREGTNPDLEVRSAMAMFGLNRCDQAWATGQEHRSDPAWTARTSSLAAACSARWGEYGEAVYWQEEAVMLDPSKATEWAMLGVYATRQGDGHLAAEALAIAQDIDPGSATLTTIQAVFALDSGEIESVLGAVETLEAGRELPHPMARFLYAWVLMDLGLPEEAAVIAISGLAQRPRSTALNAATAEAERRSGNPVVARAVLDREFTQALNGWDLVAVSVRTWVDLGQLQAARDELDQVMPAGAFNPDLVAAAWYLAGAMGNVEEQRGWAQRWSLLSESSLRSLEQLEPTGGRQTTAL
jgi:tetratricopeptide (TPR) repeat protein